MPPKASSRSSSAAGSLRRGALPPAAAATATSAPSTSAAAQLDDFVAEKLRWALAVPPEQRQPSMQGFIDSCQCSQEATRLLEAAPLAQLPGTAKLRALLLLLKAYWSFNGRPPAVPAVSLVPFPSNPQGQAERNVHDLLLSVSRDGVLAAQLMSAAWQQTGLLLCAYSS